MLAYFVAAVCISTFFECGLSLTSPADGFQKDSRGPGQPTLITLRRESVPVKKQGKVVSFRTTYSGLIGVGGPVAQEFRVVFDTGSGNVVLPSTSCISYSCLIHRRFNASQSNFAVAVNSDGSHVRKGQLGDEVDISFGTGKITGDFVRDRVCLGVPSNLTDGDEQIAQQRPSEPTCVDMNIITASDMSQKPFESFKFDGIVGLGLYSLALTNKFSFFDRMMKSGKARSPLFGVFLTEGDVEGEESEIAFGGYNAERLLDPLAWAPVAMAEYGYWQVRILAVRIDGRELDVCRDGTCRGVVDTGTSHLGIPAPHNLEVASLLSADAGELLDCRLARTPVMEIELENINLTLGAENYMRRLPLRDGVTVSSEKGVNLNATEEDHRDPSEPAVLLDEHQQDIARNCTARIMAVNMPAPIGPKLFILGEPVLHRYYTVFDWKLAQVGFSLANNHRNNPQPGAPAVDHRGELPNDVERLLMQQSVVKTQRPLATSSDEADHVFYVQLALFVKVYAA